MHFQPSGGSGLVALWKIFLQLSSVSVPLGGSSADLLWGAECSLFPPSFLGESKLLTEQSSDSVQLSLPALLCCHVGPQTRSGARLGWGCNDPQIAFQRGRVVYQMPLPELNKKRSEGFLFPLQPPR